MKAKELKARLADIEDNAEVLLTINHGNDQWFEIWEKPGLKGRITRLSIWGDKYQTREVKNAYGCRDDRYEGPAFAIEVGDLSE